MSLPNNIQPEVILNALGNGVLCLNTTGIIMYANPAALALLGYTADELHGTHISELIYNEQATRQLQEKWENSAIYQVYLKHTEQSTDKERFKPKSGEHFSAAYTASPVTEGKDDNQSVVVVFRNNSYQKNVEEKLAQLARYDTLTNLPNRKHFEEYLAKSISRAKRKNLCTSVLYINIDNFKQINENFGFDIGDMVLQQIAKKLFENVRATDFLARLDSDEFGVVLEDVADSPQSAIAAERLLKGLGVSMSISLFEIEITASIGIAVFPFSGETMDRLMENARQAMKDAKLEGKNTYHYF